MWVVLKINRNELNVLRNELNNKLDFKYKLYIPKVCYQKNFSNKKNTKNEHWNTFFEK